MLMTTFRWLRAGIFESVVVAFAEDKVVEAIICQPPTISLAIQYMFPFASLTGIVDEAVLFALGHTKVVPPSFVVVAKSVPSTSSWPVEVTVRTRTF